MVYVRTKTFKGRKYLYEQSSHRVDGKVKTKHHRYIGRVNNETGIRESKDLTEYKEQEKKQAEIQNEKKINDERINNNDKIKIDSDGNTKNFLYTDRNENKHYFKTEKEMIKYEKSFINNYGISNTIALLRNRRVSSEEALNGEILKED